ncbi:hypothetical protein KJ567_05735 [Candidatus Bipolaricaulota bacterium]|nr:hypothetical protein [Candidatus Bipolaricaulota bacterium]
MKNALLLTTIWLAILFAAYAIVYWDQGIEEPFPISVLEQAGEVAYADPDGSFSLTLPVGWSVEEIENAVLISAPGADLRGWVLAIEGEDLEVALEAAWGLIDPEFAAEPMGLESLDPQDDEGTAVIAHYDGEEAVETIYAVAQSFEGTAIVLLVRGSAEAAEIYATELAEILKGLAVPAFEATLL